MLIIFSILTLLLVLVTVLPLWENSHWTVRALEFPRLQITFLATLLLIAEFIWLDLNLNSAALILLTAFSLCWQLWWILPYTFLWTPEVALATGPENKQNTLSIINANVLTPNRQADKLLALVRKHQPDILVTLESDQWWQDQLDTLEADMPYTIKCPLDNLYGMHVYSRLPLTETATEFLVEENVPSMHALVHLRNGAKIRAHFLHPAPPSPTENAESKERDAELIVVARSITDCDQPLIVTGDLNDVAWSGTTRLFRKISGLLDPRIGRGVFNTFHVNYPFLRWPLDHLFHSSHFTLRSIQRLPPIGSDHFSLFARLVYTPQHKTVSGSLKADETDYQRAETIVKEKDLTPEDVPTPGRKT